MSQKIMITKMDLLIEGTEIELSLPRADLPWKIDCRVRDTGYISTIDVGNLHPSNVGGYLFGAVSDMLKRFGLPSDKETVSVVVSAILLMRRGYNSPQVEVSNPNVTRSQVRQVPPRPR